MGLDVEPVSGPLGNDLEGGGPSLVLSEPEGDGLGERESCESSSESESDDIPSSSDSLEVSTPGSDTESPLESAASVGLAVGMDVLAVADPVVVDVCYC